jgi:sugar lactone lactonase YvrE
MDSLGNAYFAEGGSTYLIRVMYQGGSALSAALVAANPTLSFTPTVGHMYSFGSGSTTLVTKGAFCNGTSGAVTLDVVGDGCPAEYFVSKPTIVAVDAAGNIFLGVSKWPYSGGSVHVLYVGGSAAAKLITAYNTTVTTPVVGSVYSLGTAIGGGTSSDFFNVTDIAIDSNENVYVSDNASMTTGITGTLATTAGNQIKRYVCPTCNIVDGASTGWLTYITSTGNTVGSADGDGAVATSATVSLPSGLLFDPNNNLYVIDYGNDRIRLVYNAAGSKVLPTYEQGVNSNAVVTPVAGDIYTVVGSTSGTSHFVTGILASAFVNISANTIGLDSEGNLLTSINGGIFRVSASTGIATLLSGYGGSGTYGGANTSPTTGATCNGATGGPAMTDAYDDGCPAIQVLLMGNSTSGYHIEFDSSGNYYVLDNRNIYGPVAILRKFSFAGQFGPQVAGTASTTQTLAYFPTASGKIYNPIPTIGLVSAGESTSEFADSGSNDLCSTTQTSYQTCVYYVSFKPSLAGARLGSLTLSNSGTTLVTTPLGGVGTGAQISLDPAAQSTIGTGLTPAGVAVDQGGNFYIADSSVNKIYKSTAGATPVSFATGFSSPKQVAVSGANTVYVADSGNNRIAAVTQAGVVSTFLATTFTLTTGTASTTLSNPSGVAVDLAGNVYVADTGNGRVIKVASNGAISALGFSGLSSPLGLAVDAAGDVFVADSGNSRIVELTVTGVQSAVSVSPALSTPVSVSLDAAGNLYIADPGNTNVVLVPIGSSSAITLLGDTADLSGIAVDSNGDVFIAASGAGGLIEFNRTSIAVAYPITNVGTSSSSVAVTLTNTGNSSLNTGSTLFSGTDTTDFALASATTNGCTPNESLTPGGNCLLAATFNPQSVATLTDTVSFPSSNAANLSSAKVVLGGSGANEITTSLALTVSYGQLYLGQLYVPTSQSLTVTATITPVTSGSSASGTVVFTVDGSVQKAVSVTNGTSITATMSLTLLTGPHTISAVYSGDSAYDGSSANLSIIALTPQATTLSAAYTTLSAGSVANTMNINLIGTLSYTGLVVPIGGTMAFTVDGGTPTYVSVTGSVVTTTVAVTAGSHTVVVSYSGTGVYLASSTNITFTVVTGISSISLAVTNPTGSVTFGTPVTVAAVTTTSNSTATPTGTITFTLNSVAQTAVSYAATVSSLPLSLLGPGVSNNVVNNICATYSGDSNYAPTTKCISVTTVKAASTVTLRVAPNISTAGNTFTLTATVGSALTTTPTGTVTFSYGSGTSAVSVTQTLSAGVASTTTTKNAIGSYVFTVVYSGDGNYLTSTTSVSPTPTFIASSVTSSLSVAQSTVGVATLSLNSFYGYTGNITISCTGLPANTVCDGAPSITYMTADAVQSTQIQIFTNVSPLATAGLALPNGRGRIWAAGIVCVFICFGMPLWRSRRRLSQIVFLILILTVMINFSACVSSTRDTKVYVTPTGTYTVGVVATDGTITSTVNMTLTVIAGATN